MGSDDDLILYPEGTRFTEAKKRRIESKLENEGKVELLAQSRRLQGCCGCTGGPLPVSRSPRCGRAIVGHVAWRVRRAGSTSGAVESSTMWFAFASGEFQTRSSPVPRERIQWLCKRWEELDEWTRPLMLS